MDRKTLVTLAGGLVFLIILVFVVDSLMGGLPGSVRELYGQEISEVQRAEALVSQNRDRMSGMIQKDPDFLKPLEERERWRSKMDEALQKIAEVQGVLEGEAKPLYEENNADHTQKLETYLHQLRADRIRAVKSADEVFKRVEKLVYYKARRQELVDEALNGYKSLDDARLGTLKVKADQASSDWPEKKGDITERMGVFDALKKNAQESHAFVVEENKKPDDAIDFDALVHHHDVITAARDSFYQSMDSISTLIDQLYVSWDKILEDMEIRESYEVDFFHYYKLIKINRENQSEVESKAARVNKDFYLRHEDNLGMTLESKSKGKYDFEADKQAGPPGYGYVGNSHYGRWDKDPSTGRSFWVFYGQYALMRDLFWGSSYYRPVYRNDWDSYKQTRSAGRTYYGKDTTGQKVYGSKGTMGRTKYAGSKYSTSGGYSKTQFKKTGGKYMGSKYATPKSRSSSRSRGFFSGSRGSRSFGGK